MYRQQIKKGIMHGDFVCDQTQLRKRLSVRVMRAPNGGTAAGNLNSSNGHRCDEPFACRAPSTQVGKVYCRTLYNKLRRLALMTLGFNCISRRGCPMIIMFLKIQDRRLAAHESLARQLHWCLLQMTTIRLVDRKVPISYKI
jgi:hypothetical protein